MTTAVAATNVVRDLSPALRMVHPFGYGPGFLPQLLASRHAAVAAARAKITGGVTASTGSLSGILTGKISETPCPVCKSGPHESDHWHVFRVYGQLTAGKRRVRGAG